MPKRLKLRHIAFLAAMSTILLYQNCEQAPPSDSLNSATGSSSAGNYVQQLPFAYSPVVDTIAYMSCSEMGAASYEPRAYFSFRAGAYSNMTGGLALTSAFRTATQYMSATDRGQALQFSDENSNTLMSLSIRSTGNYQTIWATSSVTAGNEIDDFLPAMNADTIAGPLAATAQGHYVNYFPGTGDKRLMEASLRFLNAEQTAQQTRNNLDNRSAVLTVGFTKNTDVLDQSLRAPTDFAWLTNTNTTNPNTGLTQNDTNSVYGIGYQMNFGLPAGYQAGDRRVISSNGITEIDLTNGNVRASNWDCSQNYEFMVVRPEDIAAGRVICNATVDRYSDSTQQAALNAIRRVLRVEDWWVDLDHHCIVPKGSGDYCYGSGVAQAQAAQPGTSVIQYGLASCVDNFGSQPYSSCPHFVSVCIRH